jgi:hypothetical protein
LTTTTTRPPVPAEAEVARQSLNDVMAYVESGIRLSTADTGGCTSS